MLDERGKLVPPMAFIPAAERYNLMPAIDRWVIRTAFATLARHGANGGGRAIELCSINLSGCLARRRALRSSSCASSSRIFGIPHSAICFEITETAAIANLSQGGAFHPGAAERSAAASRWTISAPACRPSPI